MFLVIYFCNRLAKGDIGLQEVIFFFDDSGVLHKNSTSKYFVYAGYVFTGRKELNSAKRKYMHVNKALKKSLDRTDELKASNLKPKHRHSLFVAVKDYDSVSAVVKLSRVYDYILSDKKSICRYKDYVLKRCVKDKLKRLILDGRISKDEDIMISIYIDQQLTATDGYYDLRDSIREELQHGIVNFNYGIRHSHLFDANVIVNIEYCDSSRNYMIQASDILANRIWSSYVSGNEKWRKIDNHITLTFP